MSFVPSVSPSLQHVPGAGSVLSSQKAQIGDLIERCRTDGPYFLREDEIASVRLLLEHVPQQDRIRMMNEGQLPITFFVKPDAHLIDDRELQEDNYPSSYGTFWIDYDNRRTILYSEVIGYLKNLSADERLSIAQLDLRNMRLQSQLSAGDYAEPEPGPGLEDLTAYVSSNLRRDVQVVIS